jgi:hypothetical protein
MCRSCKNIPPVELSPPATFPSTPADSIYVPFFQGMLCKEQKKDFPAKPENTIPILTVLKLPISRASTAKDFSLNLTAITNMLHLPTHFGKKTNKTSPFAAIPFTSVKPCLTF